jgi:hypothetical protein
MKKLRLINFLFQHGRCRVLVIRSGFKLFLRYLFLFFNNLSSKPFSLPVSPNYLGFLWMIIFILLHGYFQLRKKLIFASDRTFFEMSGKFADANPSIIIDIYLFKPIGGRLHDLHNFTVIS